MSRRRAALAAFCAPLLLTPLLIGGPAAATTATGATAATPATPAAPTDLPSGVPAAATAPEAVLPEPSQAAWPFPADAFPRTSGTGRLEGGATYWSDFVDDAYGAALPAALPASTAATVSALAPTNGSYVYPSGPADGDGADIFRSAVGATATDTVWRVDWATLADPAVPIAEWAIDSDGNAATGTSAWPAAAGVTSPGIDHALVVSSRGASLVDTATGAATDVLAAGGTLTVDAASRSFIVALPRSLFNPTGTSTIRLAAGLADAAGTGFAEPDVAGAGTSALDPTDIAGLPRVYNVDFRSVTQEPGVVTDGMTDALEAAYGAALAATPGATQLGLDGTSRLITGNFWNEDAQADALGSGGDVSSFSQAVDWSQLAARAQTPEPAPEGTSVRWYVTRLDLGQGIIANPTTAPSGDLRPNYLNRVQPYTVYVPHGLTPGAATPLTWVLHSLAVNHNQYAALDPALLDQLCEQRHSICATTEGFGPDGWYYDEAEVDFWSVWHAVAATYPLDPERTTISGYSMGGWASFKLGLAHPDLFSGALVLEGPPVCGIRVVEVPGVGDVKAPADAGATPGSCGSDGSADVWLRNATDLPYAITQGAAEELVPAPGNLQTQMDLDALGYQYDFWLWPAEDHLVYAVQDRFGPQVAALGGTPARVVNPPAIHYTWSPHLTRADFGIGTTTAYWLTHLDARSTDAGTLATVDATSGAIPAESRTPVRTGPTPVTDPFVGTEQTLSYAAGGAAPATLADTLALTLTGARDVSVDAARARLVCPTITTTSDGATALTVQHLTPGSVVTQAGAAAGAPVGTVDGTGSVTLPAAAGTQTWKVTCATTAATPGAAGPTVPVTGASAPTPATTVGVPTRTARPSSARPTPRSTAGATTVRSTGAGGVTAPLAPALPARTLAFTGLSSGLPAAALLLLTGTLLLGRRRRRSSRW